MTNEGKVWRCRVWPYSWRCHQDGYEPGEDFNGLPLYLEAWEEVLPTNAPSIASSNVPSAAPSNVPSVAPSDKPSSLPSESPSNVPSESPSDKPSLPPSESPSNAPSVAPSNVPSTSAAPSTVPSESHVPSVSASAAPSTSTVPSAAASNVPSESPSKITPAPSCQVQLTTARNICFALDESGSICPSEDPATYPNAKCKNFATQLNFAKSLVTALEASVTNFSVVTFASSSTVDQQLSPAAVTLNTLDGIVYSGGGTWTWLAINDCQSTLANSTVENTIVLISDGFPHYESAALWEANAAKNAGTNIVSVYIGSVSRAISFMEQASSTNTAHMASNFDDLPNIVGSVLTDVSC